MTIRLTWTNPNTASDSVTIYRDTNPINPASLPAPLATITDGSTTYDDSNNLVRNTLYYYAFSVNKNGDASLSAQKVICNMPNTGPGPTSFVRGDWLLGYFGDLTTAELFTATQLQSLVGLNAATGLDSFTWSKFAYKGKVLYFPSQHLHNSVGWNLLYSKGLVFGTTDTGPTGHSNTPVNQQIKVTKGSDEFIVRLPRTNLTPGYVQGTIDTASEWYQCVVAQWSAYNSGLLALNQLAPTWTGSPAPMAEFVAGVTTLGCAYVTGSPVPNTATPGTCARSSSSYLWRPVLEYVPS
jgi:hypothetical protein